MAASLGRSELSGWLVAIALPPLVTVTATVVLVVLGAGRLNPFWAPVPLNLVEAVTVDDFATVALLLESGADLQQSMRPGQGPLSGWVEPLTAPEAAALVDRVEMLEILMAGGLRVDEPSVRRWLCLAATTGAGQMGRYLRSEYPGWTSGELRCGPDR